MDIEKKGEKLDFDGSDSASVLSSETVYAFATANAPTFASSITLTPTLTVESKPSRKSWWLERWRIVIFGGIIASFLSLVSFAVLAAKIPDDTDAPYSVVEYDNIPRTKPLFKGSCNEANTLNIVVHFIVNVMATLLFASTAYAMQCLSAPTRTEVDAAHSNYRWLDIGVLSLRNLRSIGKGRVLLWILLALSALPLHFIYNSMFYSTTYARDFYAFKAFDNMTHADNPETWLNTTKSDSLWPVAERLRLKALEGQFTRLEPAECLQEYATPFQTTRGNVILVVEPSWPQLYGSYIWTISETLMPGFKGRIGDVRPFEWICGTTSTRGPVSSFCYNKWRTINPEQWRPSMSRVKYCLSENVAQKCTLQFDRKLVGFAISLNLLTLAILLYIFFRMESPLLTVGDAVASFLSKPDSTTKGLPLLSKQEITKWKAERANLNTTGQVYSGIRRRCASTASVSRWVVCLSLLVFPIGLFLGFPLSGITHRPLPFYELLSLPLGSLHPRGLLYGSRIQSPLLLQTCLPQFAVSALYLAYNGLLTTFAVGAELNSFGIHRRDLRVSGNPVGAQRAAFYLQLPYRFTIPLLCVGVVIHWLASQSLFMTSIIVDETHPFYKGQDNSGEILNIRNERTWNVVAYSARAILALVGVLLAMIAVVVAMGMRRLETVMPVAGSCSAAISALCHVVPERESGEAAATGLVRWGQVAGPEVRDEKGGEDGMWPHCAFSRGAAVEPFESTVYGGRGHRRDGSETSVPLLMRGS